MTKISLIIITSLFTMTSLSYADYHYASHGGSNTYPYTSWETAADSIQKAINTATAGDTIYVGSGVWSDLPCTLWVDLSLIGRGIDSTTLLRQHDPVEPIIIYPYNNSLVKGFTFDGIIGNYITTAIFPPLHAAGIKVKNNKFINLYCAIFVGENEGEISNNFFVNNWNCIDGTWGGNTFLVKNNTFSRNSLWVFVVDDGQWTIENNIFEHNNGQETIVLSIALHHLTDSCYVANNLIYHNQDNNSQYTCAFLPSGRTYSFNNTIIGPEHPVWAGFANWGILHIPVLSVNDIVTGFYQGYYNYMGDSTTVRYGATWNNQYDGQGYIPINFEEGNIHQDPMFNNPDSGDCRLQMYSPLIDAGDPNILDVDGTRSDIGCYGGPGGCSYSYLDLAPSTPENLHASLRNDSIMITWNQNTEADFWRYIINRDTLPNFAPWAGNILYEPDTSFYVDRSWDREHNYFYKIAAYDNQGNLSPYSAELEVRVVSVWGEPEFLPKATSIEYNYPNPFNSQTTICYHLANLGYQPAEVKLIICDIEGRLIKTLIDQRQYPGDYRIAWDSRNEGGESVSSGVYFARLVVSGIELSKAQRIVLVK